MKKDYRLVSIDKDGKRSEETFTSKKLGLEAFTGKQVSRLLHRVTLITDAGEGEKVVKEKAVCANCGDLTNFGNAVGDRDKRGWCTPCYEFHRKNSPNDKHKHVDDAAWKDMEKGIYKRTLYDGRAPGPE